MNEEIYYKELVDRYRQKKASDEELMVFFQLLQEGKLDRYIADPFVAEENSTVYRMPAVRRTRIWTRVAIAASLITIVSLVLFLLLYERPNRADAPSLANGDVRQQNIILHNTVVTKRGQQTQVVLPDGSKVWVNAASTLRYPASFNGKDRTVDIDGEAYFEVVKNVSMPFKVKAAEGIEITVLGTDFNVHAYKDEPVSATLIEGSIRMQSHTTSAILKPGEKASVQESGDLMITSDIDANEALAWKNGLFQFNKADIHAVMSQIEKWYDVEVVFEGKVPERQFVGTVSRNSDISEVLEILKLSKVNVKMEGKKITVLP